MKKDYLVVIDFDGDVGVVCMRLTKKQVLDVGVRCDVYWVMPLPVKADDLNCMSYAELIDKSQDV